MADLDFMKSAEKLLCPALILCGESDKTNMESAERFHKAMKNSRLIIVEGSGHEVNKELSLIHILILSSCKSHSAFTCHLIKVDLLFHCAKVMHMSRYDFFAAS